MCMRMRMHIAQAHPWWLGLYNNERVFRALQFDRASRSCRMDTAASRGTAHPLALAGNKEAIAVNQNWAGSVGSLVRKWNPAHDNASSPLAARPASPLRLPLISYQEYHTLSC